MDTKPLCLSHLEIDRWKLLWYISFFVNISFYFSLFPPCRNIYFVLHPPPPPITFLIVHLTLRAELPNLLSDTKWSSSERMNSSAAAERVHGQSLSFIQWRIQARGPGNTGAPPFLWRPNRDPKKNLFGDRPPPAFQRIWMIAPPPLPYLKVWIRHCYLLPKLLQYVTYAVTLRSHGRAEAGGHKLEHILFLKVH